MRRSAGSWAWAGLVVLLCGCNGDSDGGGVAPSTGGGGISTVTSGALEVQVTDRPPDIDRLRAVRVTFSRVELRRVQTAPITTEAFVTVYDAATDGPRTLDLLTLRGGVTATLVVDDTPQGTYDQVRLLLADAEVVMDVTTAGGLTPRTYSVGNGLLDLRPDPGTVSSGAPRSPADPTLGNAPVTFDISPGPLVVGGGAAAAQLLLDFELSQSLEAVDDALDPDGINFFPAVRARSLADAAERLRGVVRSDPGTPLNSKDDAPLPRALVEVRQAGALVAETSTDDAGAYAVTGLAPGSYQVTVSARDHRSQVETVDLSFSSPATFDPRLQRTNP